jgi:pimeloyl-ACP methyl ester carboxylesterase
MNVIESDGQGPTVLCVHGFCQSSAYWRPSLDRLAATDAHCLAVDLPGFGGSAAEPGPYTMEAFADALAQLLDRKGVASVALVGGSMGGVVA